MFWRIPSFSATSPIETILDKENFTLEELLDEEEIIQECKTLNTRLIDFLRDRAQLEKLLRFIVESAPEDAESQRVFKYPFIACEIFACEIDVIYTTLVEDEELMDLLFSFLDPNRSHNSLLAGYFSKVVVCLMLRKTDSLMKYVQSHDSILSRLVDLIGITSIMEVLVRLVGADDHMYPSSTDVMQWLSDSNLIEMIVDKLSPSNSPEVHANAADVLGAIIRSAPSTLAVKLASSSYVAKILGYALEDSLPKSTLVYSLSVCISLLDPKRGASSTFFHSYRSQYEPSVNVDPETIRAMLPNIGELVSLLDVSSDVNILPTTYGELRPPFGKHRLKIVEFIAVLLGTGDEAAEKELVTSGAIQRIFGLFFEYPFNNSLHHHAEILISSCLDSKNTVVLDHLFHDCNLVEKFLQSDKNPHLSTDSDGFTRPASGRQPPRAGYIGHITRIANKLVRLENCNEHIQTYLQENAEWSSWQTDVLQERNTIENVNRWACGRPNTIQDRARDSDDDEIQVRDYDVTALANNLSQVFRYNSYENDDADEDVYFDDESAEVVISSLRLGEDTESAPFTNSDWFNFQGDRNTEEPLSSPAIENMEDVNLSVTANNANDELKDPTDSSRTDSDLVVETPDEPTEKTSPEEGAPTNNDSTPVESETVENTQHDESNLASTSEPTEQTEAEDTSTTPSLFEGDAEFVSADLEGDKRNIEFSKSHWMVEPEVGLVKE